MTKKKSMLSCSIVSRAKKLNAQILEMNKQCSKLIAICLNEKGIPKRVVRIVGRVCGLNSEHVDVLKELSCL